MAESRTQRRGLGRGLGSLIQSTARARGADRADTRRGQPPCRSPAALDLAPVPGASFAELPVDRISPNAAQPRQVFDEEAMAELVHSIREVGLLQPVVVRPVERRRGRPARYELVMGERRWRATQEAGLGTIPAIIRETDDTDMLRDALLENLHRSQLNPLEEAAAYAPAARGLRRAPTRSWPPGSAARDPRSPTPSGCSGSRRPSSAGWPPASCRPATPGRCSASRTPSSRTGWPQRVVAEGISVRGLEEIVAVGVEDQRGPARRHRVRSRRRPVWPSSPTGSRTGSRPGSRSTSAGPRARSPSSSPASTTCAGSSTSWTRATATRPPDLSHRASHRHGSSTDASRIRRQRPAFRVALSSLRCDSETVHVD